MLSGRLVSSSSSSTAKIYTSYLAVLLKVDIIIIIVIIIIIIIILNLKWIFTQWQWYCNKTQHTNNTHHTK
jgi:hypothetical protein